MGAVLLAVAVWIGAVLAHPAPRWLAVLGVAVGLLWRRPALLVVASCALASALAAAAWSGLEPPLPASVAGRAVLAGDPVSFGGGVRVELRIAGRRVEAWASGEAASTLRDALAGEVVDVEGRWRPPPPEARHRLAVRHVSARLDVQRVERRSGGSPLSRVAGALRRTLDRGARSIPAGERALLMGVLVGDDRELPPAVEADFRAAGLTHLLAVSGQNVAYVLAIAGPALRRVGLRGRLVLSLAVIGTFAVVTRAEPSVLRASAMAALACGAAFAGRPVSRLRILSLAVAALVIVDPLLVWSVGFQLSVGASLGLVLLASTIASRLPGPRWLAEPLAVTIAAQVGVAPVLVSTFGGIPAVTLVANLLAVPAAAPLTGWGLPAGLLAGALGPPFDAVLHVPTRLLLEWLGGVARAAARAPVGMLGGWTLVAIGGLLALSWWRRSALIAAGLVLVLASRLPSGELDGVDVAGARVWRDGAVVVVLDGRGTAAPLLDGLHDVGVRRIDLLVARAGGRTTAAVIADVRTRLSVGAIAAPAGHRIRDASAVAGVVHLTVGGLAVELTPSGGGLDVHVRR